MVPQASATQHAGQESVKDSIPLDADHSNIVRFPSFVDSNYKTIQGRIMDMVDRAPGVIQERIEYKGYRPFIKSKELESKTATYPNYLTPSAQLSILDSGKERGLVCQAPGSTSSDK